MSELLAMLIGIGAVALIEFLKPEWLIGWLLNLLAKKLPNKSNSIENSLGMKMIETGLYIIKSHPDSDKANQILNEIESKMNELKDEVKNH